MVLKLNELRGRLGIIHMWYQAERYGGGFCRILVSFVFLVKVYYFFLTREEERSNFFIFSLMSYLNDPLLEEIDIYKSAKVAFVCK